MKILLAWSSGKDSAYALHVLRESGHEIVGLVTTITRDFDRVSMHGVRRAVVEAQAAAAGIPLRTVEIPYPCPNETYERAMHEALDRAKREEAVEGIAFGDLFLEDVRAYRERALAPTGLVPLFPLWGRNTIELAEEMIASGLEARVAVLDPQRVDPALAGARFDHDLLDRLAPGVDPCAERGEFHTVVSFAPGFIRQVPLAAGPTVARDGFVFRDFTIPSAPVGSPGD